MSTMYAEGDLIAGQYRVRRHLGSGGNGQVYAAELDDTEYAIKVLRPDSADRTEPWAVHQARALGQIRSEHVVRVDAPRPDGQGGSILVMELLAGETFISLLKREGPLTFDQLAKIGSELWQALIDVHAAGVAHRNIKPSNIFLRRAPGTTRTVLIDFCMARLPGGNYELPPGGRQSLGTFSFMPPEAIGKAKTFDHRADIYACGTTLFQALTGQLPYAAKNILQMVDLKSKHPPRKLSEALPGAAKPLEEFLDRCLARDPNARFQTAQDAKRAWDSLGD